MSQRRFFMDFDEDPKLGGQQAFFFIGDPLAASELRGCRILDFHF